MTPAFTLEDLKFTYGGGLALDIDRLEIPQGTVTGLVGPNGSGKSTLLKVLACLYRRTSGTLLYMGEPIDGREDAIRREVTLLLQDPYLLKRTVYENIAYGLKLRGISRDEIASRSRESLESVGLAPDDFGPRKWFSLSGGEAQRASLAVRLALRPRVLLLDEPTASVDEGSAELIKQAAIDECERRGTTIIASTHDTAWLDETAGSVVSLYAGRPIGGASLNFIRGAWRSDGGGIALLEIGGVKMTAKLGEGEQPTKCGVISPDDVIIEKIGENAKSGVRCRLSSLALERSSGKVIAAVSIGAHCLRSRMTHERASSLSPGDEVVASFSPESVRFI